MIETFSTALGDAAHDICVVGAGPVGITLALELARRGRRVLLLESGLAKLDPRAEALGEAEILTPQHQAPMSVTNRRSLGGASNLWGGRCVPLDRVDFLPRAAVPGSGWPIRAQDLEPYLSAACEYAMCGQAHFFEPFAGQAIGDADFSFEHLERWSRQPRFKDAYAERLRAEPNLRLVLGATVAGLRFHDDGRVCAATVCGLDGTRTEVAADRFALTAGGLETTRLLLTEQARAPHRFGGSDGTLGRYYMGHTIGGVADITLSDARLDGALDYVNDGRGAFARRRFTPSPELQEREGLSNIAFWPEFPPIWDASHGDAVMSLGYLVLSVPWIGRLLVAEAIRRSHTGLDMSPEPVRALPHIANLLKGLPAAARFFPRFLYGRYLGKPRLPGFFQTNPGRRYAIRFHAEHAPHRDSRVSLSDQTDAFGLPRLKVELRFHESDVRSVVRAHVCFGEWLARTGLGRMEWSFPEAELEAEVMRQCNDGHHQIGTVRMAASSDLGVVDADCRVFGAPNLFVAGSAVFPSSSQANPTLTAILLAVRLAEHLAGETRA
ncbi:MAG: GMC family oxidoreductase [Caulobacteraceae bacterium]